MTEGSLIDDLRRGIALDGPISVERYMARCLAHYYGTRDPFGAGGDFTTAPEISQMFGELIGLWAAEVWMAMQGPTPLRIVELGPGRGTLMADALRVARIAPAFLAALEVHLVETSPALRSRQEETLGDRSVPVSWHADLSEVPPGPAVLIANEFLDALPIRQYVRSDEDRWHERLVGLDADDEGRFAFGLAARPERALRAPGRPGDVLEVPVAGIAAVRALARRLAAQGGAALLIDYGHVRSGFGDTLQALRGHAFTGPLESPGEADLTAHVDFDQLARGARAAGARVHGPVTQGAFLRALGIEARASQLKTRATEAQAGDIDAALARLTDEETPRAMGALFKVMALSHPDLAVLPGFETPDHDAAFEAGPVAAPTGG